MGKERSYIVCANNNYASRIMGEYARRKKRIIPHAQIVVSCVLRTVRKEITHSMRKMSYLVHNTQAPVMFYVH